MALNYNKIRLYDDIVDKYYIYFNLDNISNKRYLKYNNIYSNMRGYSPHSHTIINKIIFKNSNIIDGEIKLLDKNTSTVLYTLTISNTNKYVEHVSIIIDDNIELMIYIESVNRFNNPEVCLELII